VRWHGYETVKRTTSGKGGFVASVRVYSATAPGLRPTRRKEADEAALSYRIKKMRNEKTIPKNRVRRAETETPTLLRGGTEEKPELTM